MVVSKFFTTYSLKVSYFSTSIFLYKKTQLLALVGVFSDYIIFYSM